MRCARSRATRRSWKSPVCAIRTTASRSRKTWPAPSPRCATPPPTGSPATPCGWTAAKASWDDGMTDDSLDCLDLLESTPAMLRDLMSEISEDDARWKPAPDRFSIAEVLAHLSHSEGHCYRARLDRFLSEELPEFEPDDASFYYDLYRQANPQDSFDHFEEQRETNVEFMRTLPHSAGDRRALHREAGEITLSQMLPAWAMHDLGHIRQVPQVVHCPFVEHLRERDLTGFAMQGAPIAGGVGQGAHELHVGLALLLEMVEGILRIGLAIEVVIETGVVGFELGQLDRKSTR